MQYTSKPIVMVSKKQMSNSWTEWVSARSAPWTPTGPLAITTVINLRMRKSVAQFTSCSNISIGLDAAVMKRSNGRVLYSCTGALMIEALLENGLFSARGALLANDTTKANWVVTNIDFLCLVAPMKYPLVPTCKFTGESNVDRLRFIYQTNSY